MPLDAVSQRMVRIAEVTKGPCKDSFVVSWVPQHNPRFVGVFCPQKAKMALLLGRFV